MSFSDPFQIKICGITNNVDAKVAAQAGADAIGLNFYAKSLRSVTAEIATKIETPSDVARVGVFVNHTVDAIETIADQCGLSFVQLHGNETPEFARQLNPDRPIISVIRIAQSADLESVTRAADAWLSAELPMRLAAILLDAQVGKSFGGTGHQVDWELASQFVDRCGTPVILAGGLHAENVLASIETVQPAGVDVASGVEGLPGKKDAQLVGEFVKHAKLGFQGRLGS